MKKGYISEAIYEAACELLHDPDDPGEPDTITVKVARDGFEYPVSFRLVPVMHPSIMEGNNYFRWELIGKVETSQ